MGRVLNSEELVELLYIAYNRDEADIFWMDKIKQAGFEELYSTAPDVMDKKLKLLDKQIEEKSIELANKKISEARSEKDIIYADKLKNEKKLVEKKAKELIKKHSKYIGSELANKAIEKLKDKSIEDTSDNSKNEIIKEETIDVNIQKKVSKGRPRKNQ